MDSKALIPVGQRELTPNIWQMINEMAPVMHQSRLFGVASKEAAAAIMLKGYELGLSITASFEFVQVVEGKPSLSPRGALALLHNSPEIKRLEVKRLEANGGFIGYACYMERANGFSYMARYTLEDAKRAGLIKPRSGWEAYPENMCMWRAIGFAADVVAPDITAGMTALMKMPEQYGVAVSQEGEIIDMTPRNVPLVTEQPTPTQSPAAWQGKALSLDDLLVTWTAEQILVANEGRIPGTDAELAAVAAKLAGEQ